MVSPAKDLVVRSVRQETAGNVRTLATHICYRSMRYVYPHLPPAFCSYGLIRQCKETLGNLCSSASRSCFSLIIPVSWFSCARFFVSKSISEANTMFITSLPEQAESPLRVLSNLSLLNAKAVTAGTVRATN